MNLLKKVPVFISIFFLAFFFTSQGITAQVTEKDTAGCPYDYTKPPTGDYKSTEAQFLDRAITLSALEELQQYRTDEFPRDSTFVPINTAACWDSMFLYVPQQIRTDVWAIQTQGIDNNLIFYAVRNHGLQDSLDALRNMIRTVKAQIDTIILEYRDVDNLEQEAAQTRLEIDSLQKTDDSLQNNVSQLHALTDSLNLYIETMKVSIFGTFLANDSSAFQRYKNLLDTIKILLRINALPESARLAFLTLNNDSIVNNTETFNRIEADVWHQIAHDVEGTLMRFFPSVNDLEMDFQCANILISLIQHTEDTTNAEIFPLITAFWDCYWAGEEEQHLQEFALDPDLNIHDEAGVIDIAQLEEMRLSLIQRYDTLYLSDTQLIVLNLLETIYEMNQEGRLSQKAADVAQELLFKSSGTEIVEIRERFWKTVKTDFEGMLQSFRRHLDGREIKDNCLEIIATINRLEKSKNHKTDTQTLNDLIYRFWLCQH